MTPNDERPAEELPVSAVLLRIVGWGMVVVGVFIAGHGVVDTSAADPVRQELATSVIGRGVATVALSAFAFGLASIVDNIARIARKP